MNTTTREQELVVVPQEQRFRDFEHGFKRGWGVSRRKTKSQHLSMGHGILPAGQSGIGHSHDIETAIYIINGSVRVHYGDDLNQTVTVYPGDFIFIPPGVPHYPANDENDEPMEYVVARNSPIED